MDIMADIEKQLREAARRSGLSILALSKRWGVSYAVAHRFVTGTGGITLKTAAKLARTLGLELCRKGR